MGRRRNVHIHLTVDYDPNEPRKAKGQAGGGQWTKGGGGQAQAAPGKWDPTPAQGRALYAKLQALPLTEANRPAGGREYAEEERRLMEEEEAEENAYEPGRYPNWRAGGERAIFEHPIAKRPGGETHIHVHGLRAAPPVTPSKPLPMGQQSPAPPQGHGQGQHGRWAWEQRQPVHDEHFSGHDYWKAHYKPNVTQASLYATLAPPRRAEMEEIEKKGDARPWTISKYRDPNGRYTPERKALHDAILRRGVEGADDDDYSRKKRWPALLSPEEIKKATPLPGHKPVFIMLGGRGGSGKTKLNGRVYDEAHTLVLDSDKIKHMLPEFAGWNAAEVHEESSDILDLALKYAREHGLNVVLDATLKSFDGADQKLKAFEDAGYCTEGHYMSLPADKASMRSIGRYFSPSEKAGADPNARGRFVAPKIILGNVNNEDNFDKLRPRWKGWSFWNNDVPMGQEPELLARGGGSCD